MFALAETRLYAGLSKLVQGSEEFLAVIIIIIPRKPNTEFVPMPIDLY